MQKKEDIPTWFRETSNSTIEHMHDSQSEVRVATFYRPHGIYDTEANMNDLETDGYYVVWGWKVFFLILITIAVAQKNKAALMKHARKF